LALGCGFIPIDELDEAMFSPLHFSIDHHPYFNREIVFSHQVHERFTECSECHGASTTPEDVNAGDLPAMKKCFKCHDGKQRSQDCETCHAENRRQRKPRFHTGQWTTHHKDMAYAEAYKCALCHQESECQQCHSTWKPQSHTLRFNRSTHGRMAVQDRRSCATCHSTDFCENCHSQPPPDHTPSFRAGGHGQAARLRERSCLTCHRFEHTCAECHGSTRGGG
jgi:hypothetical protein